MLVHPIAGWQWKTSHPVLHAGLCCWLCFALCRLQGLEVGRGAAQHAPHTRVGAVTAQKALPFPVLITNRCVLSKLISLCFLHSPSAPRRVHGSPPQVEQPHILQKRPSCGCSSGRISAKQHQQWCSIPGCAAPHVAAEVREEPLCAGCDSAWCFSSKLIRLFSGLCSSRLPCGSPVWV